MVSIDTRIARPAPIAPSLDCGGSGPVLHFLHANGYPPECYSRLIGRLKESHHVFGMLLRPLWPESDPNSIKDWRPHSEDLREYVGAMPYGPVIGLGHSLGAIVTLRAAIQYPELFRALILIEPVLLPPWRIVQSRLLRAVGLAGRLSRRIAGARSRRRMFDSLEQLFNGYRRREIFRRFSDEDLWSLIRGLTQPRAEGAYGLVYSPDWEARIYETGIWNDLDLWKGLPELKVPTMIIRGSATDTFWQSTADIVSQKNPSIKVTTIPDATHLVPLESPDEVADAVRSFLEETNV